MEQLKYYKIETKDHEKSCIGFLFVNKTPWLGKVDQKILGSAGSRSMRPTLKLGSYNQGMISTKIMPISETTIKIKHIESLASIGINVEDDEEVKVFFYGLTRVYKPFKNSI